MKYNRKAEAQTEYGKKHYADSSPCSYESSLSELASSESPLSELASSSYGPLTIRMVRSKGLR